MKNSKERIIDELDQTKMKCPFCRNTKFYKNTTEVVEIIDNGASIMDEPLEEYDESYSYKCMKCKKIIDEEEMVR